MLSDIIQEQLLTQLKNKKSSNVNRDFLCQNCQKKFQKLAHLSRHIKQKHQNQRTYICNFENCKKSFKRDSHLKRHMISHTHQKSYKCSQCIMAFGYKHHLDRHIKVIHNNELLKCPQCEQKFIKKKALSKHYDKIHNIGESKSNNITQSSKKKIKKKGQSFLNQQNKYKSIKFDKINKQKQSNQGQDQQEELFFSQEEANNNNQIQSQQNQEQSVKYKEEQKYKKIFLQKKQQKNEFFRCIYMQCPMAFKHKHQLQRHIQRVNHEDMMLFQNQQRSTNKQIQLKKVKRQTQKEYKSQNQQKNAQNL